MKMKSTIRKREWLDNESFWREFYLFMFPEEHIAVADEQIEKVVALTKPTGNSVLDLCCGPGRCSFALTKRGYSDYAPNAERLIAVARKPV